MIESPTYFEYQVNVTGIPDHFFINKPELPLKPANVTFDTPTPSDDDMLTVINMCHRDTINCKALKEEWKSLTVSKRFIRDENILEVYIECYD